ncbi:MAG: PBP1A family penicillin-binding protein [Asticcacaulis sp.]|nr:PBP1A family penicillin-binding protein [Asticcacaulis sp.]
MAKASPPGGGRKSSGRTPAQSAVYWGAVGAIWVVIFSVVFLGVMAIDLPDIKKLQNTQQQHAITYLDRSGALIAVRGGSQYAAPVDIDELPSYVPLAFVAIEDRRFFTHPGFDPMGMGRAIVRNAFRHKGSNLAGGSTITQQLARNLFLSADQNVKRKVQELMIAVWLEHKYTKKQILALYLNHVYFGAGAYGIEAASERYFNKQAKNLTVGEAAMLAGLMKAPNSYSPLSDKERAGKRATIVLNEMVDAKVITPEQRTDALSHPITVSKSLATAHAQYFIDWLDSNVRALVGDPKEDLIVETTLDLPIQTDAERAVQTIMSRDVKRGVQQAAVVSVDGEGRIRAMIGGVSYADSQFNRATMAFRQTGSSFKPFVYLTAMEAGYQPTTPVVDEPYSIGDWSPQNFEKSYMGLIDLQTALAESINTVAARLANDVGRDRVAATAHRMGITSKINTDPAMALGTSEVTPLELAQAYVPFSNGGFKATAHGIIRIRTASGQLLYQYRDSNQDGGRVQVVNNPPLTEMNQMLRGVVQHGTGAGVNIPGYDLAGKTGTTSDFRDAWFAGYTGGFVTIVWVGRDDNTPMKKVTGGSTPAAIWKTYMISALKRIQVSPIPVGPADQSLGTVAESALQDLLGTQAGQVQASQAAPADGQPPIVTMQPIPNPEDKPKKDGSLDDVFSQAEQKNQ